MGESTASETHMSKSHVSASEPSVCKCDVHPTSTEEIERDLHVVEFVVDALFTEKKRQLALAIEKETASMPTEKRVKMDCRCGCQTKPESCKTHTELKTRDLEDIVHRLLPMVEKQVIKDLTRALCTTQRSQWWFSVF